MAARIVEWALRLLLAGIFLWAGVTKALGLQDFVESIENFQIVGPALRSVGIGSQQLTSFTVALLLGVYLPWVEILCALALLTRRLYSGALLGLGAMLTVFIGALASAWWRDLDISCGCFGRSEGPSNLPLLMARNAMLLGAVIALGVMERWRTTTMKGQPSPAAKT